MSDLNESFEDGALEAEARGDEVLVATDRQLFIDIDNDEQRKHFDRMLSLFIREYGAVSVDRWQSKTPGHEHVVVTITEREQGFSVAERVALQAILGSDTLRELLTLKRLHSGIEQPVRLFKPRDAKPMDTLALAGLLADGDDDLPF